jgi:hypothetical protein
MDGPVTEIVLGNGLGNALIKGGSISALEQPDQCPNKWQVLAEVVDPCITVL